MIPHVFRYAIAVFLFVQLAGLYVGAQYVEAIKAGSIEPMFEKPEDTGTAFNLFLYILVATAVLLVLLKLNMNFFIKVMLMLSIFMGMTITFVAFIDMIGILFALFLILVWQKSALLKNIALVLGTTGIGAFIGSSLGILPAALFLLILAIYDITAVFFTKHMVLLAESASRKDLPLTISFPPAKTIERSAVKTKGKDVDWSERDSFEIGTGDFVVPLIFSVSVLRDFPLYVSILSVSGATIGLVSLFVYISGKKHSSLPALPPIAVGAFCGFMLGCILFR